MLPEFLKAKPQQIALVFLIGASYSLLLAVNKIAVTHGVPSSAYVFWHCLGAGLITGLLALARRERYPLGPKYLFTYAVWGLLSVAAPITLLTWIAPNLPAGIITLTLILVPLVTYGLSVVFAVDRFRVLSVLGILMGAGGVLIVALPDQALPSGDMVGWLLLALLAPVSFGMVTVFVAKFRPPACGSLPLVSGLFLAAAIMLVPVMAGFGHLYVFPGPDTTGDLAILYATLLSCVIFWLFLEVISVSGPTFVTQHNFIAVLSGFGWGALFFSEEPSWLIWVATLVMFGGLGLHTYSTRREAARGAAVQQAAD